MFTGVYTQMIERRQRRHWVSIRALRCQSVEGVGCAKNAGAKWYVFAGEPMRVAGSVPMLVMVLDELERCFDVKERSENVQADLNVPLYVLELFGRKAVGLVQDRFTDA